MKKQITAFAQAEEVPEADDFRVIRITVHVNDVAPKPADVLRRRRVSLFGYRRAGTYDGLASDLAVKANPHKSARAQQVHQDPPSVQRVAKMVKYASAFDKVELPSEAS